MPTEEHFVSHIDFGDGVVRTIKDPNASGTAVVGVKGDAEEDYRSGRVNITKENIGLGDVENLKQVSATENQGLTDTEKDYARDNLGLGTAAVLDVPSSGDASSTEVVLGSDSRLTDARQASDVYSWAKAENKPSYTPAEVGAVDVAMVGVAGGIAELDSLGKVPAAQLPSYVDDVLEYADLSSFPATGESGKIYVAQDTNKTYRWSGSGYVVISETLALGETDSTAYRGDRGKTAYDHSQSTHARTDATKTEASSTNGNIKINGTETTVYTHPGSGTNPHGTTKSDVGLGNVGNFKAVSTVASQGLTDTEKSNARANIGAGTSSLTIGTTASTAAAGNHTHGLSIAADSGTASINLAANTTYKLTAGGSTYIFKTPVDNNTTYSSKTAASGGTDVSLVTTGEKYTWNNKSTLAIGTTATTAAAGNHTHGLSIAADSGTSSISLAASTKYKITAGGSTFVFTSTPNTNTWRGIQDNLTSSSNTTESLSAKQGYLLANGSARDNTKIALDGATAIAASSSATKNLNSYTTVGNYTCTSNEASKYVSNQPIAAGTAFNLTVIKVLNSTAYLRQYYYTYNDNNLWVRVSTNTGSSWGAWKAFKSQADIDSAVAAAKVGTAGAAQVLTGYTFTNSTTSGVPGTMANQGAKTSSLNCGGSYTIPAGYHNGSGKITANSLASQTGVDSGKTAAAAGQILTGYQAWVNGSKITGSMASNGAWSKTLSAGTTSQTGSAGYYSSVKATVTKGVAKIGSTDKTWSSGGTLTLTFGQSLSIGAGAYYAGTITAQSPSGTKTLTASDVGSAINCSGYANVNTNAVYNQGRVADRRGITVTAYSNGDGKIVVLLTGIAKKLYFPAGAAGQYLWGSYKSGDIMYFQDSNWNNVGSSIALNTFSVNTAKTITLPTNAHAMIVFLDFEGDTRGWAADYYEQQ